jgi:hypothetical protein
MPVSGGPQSYDPVFNPSKCTVIPVAPIAAIPNIDDCQVLAAPDTIFDCPDPAIPLPGPPGVPGTRGAGGQSGPTGATGPQGPCPQLQAQVQAFVDGVPITAAVSVAPCNEATPQQQCCWEFSFSFEFPQGPQGPQGGKSVILPYRKSRNSPTKFVGLLCAEMPEARFEDVIVIKDPDFTQPVDIDRKLLDFCVPGSVVVCGTACDLPVALGARVHNGRLHLACSSDLPKGTSITIRVSGIRRDQPTRWPEFTEDQYRQNTKFWNKAHNG